MKFAMRNFKDESFILQLFSPKVIRDLKLFAVVDENQQAHIEVNAIHDEEGYRAVRQPWAGLYNLGNREPNIQVYNVNIRGDRSLTLHHTRHSRKPLDNSAEEVLRHVHRLWGFDVHLHSMEGDNVAQSSNCPPTTREPHTSGQFSTLKVLPLGVCYGILDCKCSDVAMVATYHNA